MGWGEEVSVGLRLRVPGLEENPTRGLRMEYMQQSPVLRSGEKPDGDMGSLGVWVMV